MIGKQERTAELAWIRQLFCDLHVPITQPPLIYCDNISAITLSTNPVFHCKAKHIEIHYHIVHERVTRRDLQVQHVSSTDILTKCLSAPLCNQHCGNLMLSSSHDLEGEYKSGEIKGSKNDTCHQIKES